MELQAWMAKNGTNSNEVASELGINKTSVYYWAAVPPQRMPSPVHMLQIVKLTKGRVTPVDFYPDCLKAIKKLRNGKRKSAAASGHG